MEPRDEATFRSAPGKLRALREDQRPRWGGMSAQQMVEHLVGSWRISNGRAQAKPALSAAETERRREFLFSDLPYPRNLANPLFAKGLPPLRKPSLEAAIEQLADEINTFFAHHRENGDAIEVHPVYGPLDYEGWMRFQTKHVEHHFAQFGLKL